MAQFSVFSHTASLVKSSTKLDGFSLSQQRTITLAKGYGSIKVGSYFTYRGDFRVKKENFLVIHSINDRGSFKWYWLNGGIKDFTGEFSSSAKKLLVKKDNVGFKSRSKWYGGILVLSLTF